MHMETTTCPKCHGQKKLQRYSHIAEGDCFECKATGVVSASKGGVTFDDAPESVIDPEIAISHLRHYYGVARRLGAEYFTPESDETGTGFPEVLRLAAALDAAKRAHVVAAFEALRA
jgi:hypothetical protein